MEQLNSKVCYVFQGGGALGAYQLGAIEAFDEKGYSPDMIVGISIGAFNAAIFAGNKPEDRLDKLRLFWKRITDVNSPLECFVDISEFNNMLGAAKALFYGQNNFFNPRFLIQNDNLETLSYYDTNPLRENLLDLIDFEYLNQGNIHICVGAVELKSGEFVFFDNKKEKITIEHILASGALPPAFAPVKVHNKYYIDGGVYSNTPIFRVIDEFHDKPEEISNVLCFMVDLFSLEGEIPKTIDNMIERVKDIKLASHSKHSGNIYSSSQNLSHAIKYLSKYLTEEAKEDKKIQSILQLANADIINVVHIVYRNSKGFELSSKGYNFNRNMSIIHQQQGYMDTISIINNSKESWEKSQRVGITIFNKEGSFKLS